MATTGVYKHMLSTMRSSNINLLNYRIAAMAIDLTQGYTVDLNADKYITVLPSNSEIKRGVLEGKSIDDLGAFRADDTILYQVEAGKIITALALFIDTGIPNNSNLIWYSDDATNLPITADGDNVVIQWPDPIFS